MEEVLLQLEQLCTGADAARELDDAAGVERLSSELAQLKAEMMGAAKVSHGLQTELHELERRIALQIRHRMEVLDPRAHHRKEKEGKADGAKRRIEPDDRRRYERLTYLLRVNPAWLAQLLVRATHDKAPLVQAVELLRSTGSHEIEMLQSCAPKPPPPSGNGTLAASECSLPPQPQLIDCTSSSVCLKPRPFAPSKGAQVCRYSVYGKPAGAGVAVSLNNDKYEGTGEKRAAKAGVDAYDPLAGSFTITGLPRGQILVFAVAAFDETGEVIGGIGRTAARTLTSLFLPRLLCWASLGRQAAKLGCTRAAWLGLQEVEKVLAIEQDVLPLWMQSPLQRSHLSPKVAANSALAELRTAAQLMLLAPELHTPYNAHVAPGAHRPIEAQLDTMRKVQRLQLGLQLAMSIGDHKLAGCAVQQLYHSLTPLLRASQRSPFLLQPLALCHETLRAIPTEDLHSIKRAPQLLTCTTFEILTLCSEAKLDHLASHFASVDLAAFAAAPKPPSAAETEEGAPAAAPPSPQALAESDAHGVVVQAFAEYVASRAEITQEMGDAPEGDAGVGLSVWAALRQSDEAAWGALGSERVAAHARCLELTLQVCGVMLQRGPTAATVAELRGKLQGAIDKAKDEAKLLAFDECKGEVPEGDPTEAEEGEEPTEEQSARAAAAAVVTYLLRAMMKRLKNRRAARLLLARCDAIDPPEIEVGELPKYLTDHSLPSDVGGEKPGLLYQRHEGNRCDSKRPITGVTKSASVRCRLRGGGCIQSKASGPEDVTHELAEVEIVVEKPVEKAAEVAVDKVAAEGVEEMTRQKMGEQVVVPPALDGKLVAHDFAALFQENRGKHLAGTREWAFSDILAWLNQLPAPQLFWLMGGGGTGKSVLSAELLGRLFARKRVAAWHFCRHDNKEQSKPASLLRSLCAMLCHTLDGFEAALDEVPDATVTDPTELFRKLLEAPLRKMKARKEPLLIIIDALDELPKEWQQALLSVIAGQLSSLPSWLRLFVTSREEPQIKAALKAFNPRELRADEAKNRADVEVYLRTIARTHVKGEVSMATLEGEILREFGVDMRGRMAELEPAMAKSREIYMAARTLLEALPGFAELLTFDEERPDAVQAHDEFEKVYANAGEAQGKLTGAVATAWEPDAGNIRHPVEGTTLKPWIEMADDPGVKGATRAKEKVENDYDGHANKLKDLARLTLRFTRPKAMAQALRELKDLGFRIVVLKNKYRFVTPLGYSDFNLVVAVTLADGTDYLCEVQLNLVQMLEAKHLAHDHYEVVRKALPKFCQESGITDPTIAEKVESFIMGRLNNSALDGAVAAFSGKAEGLFLYAHLLNQHLDAEAAAGRELNFANLGSLPTGLGGVYETNFLRAFPAGADGAGWQRARPLIELILASTRPLSVEMAEALLNWDDEQRVQVLDQTGLLFPVREGTFHIFHKSVADWLTTEAAGAFAVERKELHVCFAAQLSRLVHRDAEVEVWRRRVFSVLVSAGLPIEWLRTAGEAARGVEAAAAEALVPLAAKDALAVGMRVLAVGKVGNWMSGLVTRVGDTVDVSFGGSKVDNQPRTKALVISVDGAGALLRSAAGSGNATLIEALLAKDVSQLVADQYASTPLHFAAAGGHVEICRLLLDKGADKAQDNAKQQSAAHLAQVSKQHSVTRLFYPTLSDREFTEEACTATERLCAARAGDVAALKKTTDHGQITALMVACRSRQYEAVVALETDVDARSASGCTALYLAAEEGDERIVRLLLERRADLSIADSDGGAPLLRACAYGHKLCVVLMIKAKANLEAQMISGFSALMLAAQNGHEQVARALIEAKANLEAQQNEGWTALMYSAQNGHDQVVRALIEKGADVDHACDDGRTALMQACKNGHDQVARALLENGADIEKPNNNGWTPLMKAAQVGHEQVARALIENGAEIDKVGPQGFTALMFASSNGHEQVARALIEAGASLAVVSKDNFTMLMAASYGGLVSVLNEVLPQSDLDAVVADSHAEAGYSALMYACKNGHDLCARALLENGAAVNSQNNEGQTALMWAAQGGHDQVARALLEAGARKEVTNSFGETALSIARRKGHTSICKLLES